MKNAQQKREFLNTLPVENQILLERVFRTAEPLEDSLNKDCSLFSMEEIDMLFGKERLKGTRSVARKCDLLTKYTAWMQQRYPVKYATYSAYAEKYNLYVPVFTADHLNPLRVYTPSEFEDTLDEMTSFYDQMLFLAVYEGVWTSTHVMDFFLIRERDLDPEHDIVRLDSGRELPISPMLMSLLVEGGSHKKRDGNGVQNSTFDCIMYRDPTVCYKRLNIDPQMDLEENKIKIKNHIQNTRRSVQRELSNPDKLTLLNIQMSGFLNTLIDNGVTERFNDNRMYEENPRAAAVADRYDITYKNTQKNNFHRRFEPYFLCAE